MAYLLSICGRVELDRASRRFLERYQDTMDLVAETVENGSGSIDSLRCVRSSCPLHHYRRALQPDSHRPYIAVVFLTGRTLTTMERYDQQFSSGTRGRLPGRSRVLVSPTDGSLARAIASGFGLSKRSGCFGLHRVGDTHDRLLPSTSSGVSHWFKAFRG